MNKWSLFLKDKYRQSNNVYQATAFSESYMVENLFFFITSSTSTVSTSPPGAELGTALITSETLKQKKQVLNTKYLQTTED